jgi:fluoride exporter
VIAIGGALGAVARQLISEALPQAARGFPFGTFVVNVSGCLLIGLLMVSIVEVRRPHRLVRPFLGGGLLGGYTTFSTYAVGTQRLIQAGDPRVAFAYFGGTVSGRYWPFRLVCYWHGSLERGSVGGQRDDTARWGVPAHRPRG